MYAVVCLFVPVSLLRFGNLSATGLIEDEEATMTKSLKRCTRFVASMLETVWVFTIGYVADGTPA